MGQTTDQTVKPSDRQTRRSSLELGSVARRDGADIATVISPTTRRAPRLRRSFPPLEPEREASLRERNRAAFADDPRRVELERRLLDLGGTFAPLFLPDPQIGELLDRGRSFPGARALMRLGEPSACHANAAMMLVVQRKELSSIPQPLLLGLGVARGGDAVPPLPPRRELDRVSLGPLGRCRGEDHLQ